MKKEEFVALGISEELAEKAEKESLKELDGYIPKAEHEAAKQSKEQLEKDISDRDKQLEELKKTAGAGTEFKKQIETLQEENKKAKQEYEDSLKELKISTAVKLAIAADAQDVDIVAGLIDAKKLVLSDDGKISGLEEQVKELKTSKAFLFKADAGGQGQETGAAQQKPGYKPRAGGTTEGSIAKAVAETLNKEGADSNNPYANAWG